MKIITIDGPASSGKGTVARLVAAKLGYNYLESGAIYRAVALAVQKCGVSSDDVAAMLAIIKTMVLEFAVDGTVLLSGENVTKLLRGEAVGMLASKIAALAAVRAELLQFQRNFATEPGLVTDGRDMGSVVFPQANLKIFLTASAEVRAERRWQELQFGDKSVTIAAILCDILQRDKDDSERVNAPLTYDESFVLLDNSQLSIDETVSRVLNSEVLLPGYRDDNKE